MTPPRWTAWIAPPFEPYAPALVAAGVPLAQQLIIRTSQALWALEQTLVSGGCALVLGWPAAVPSGSALRRLQLATQRGGAPAFLFRPLSEAARSSAAELRIACESLPAAEEPWWAAACLHGVLEPWPGVSASRRRDGRLPRHGMLLLPRGQEAPRCQLGDRRRHPQRQHIGLSRFSSSRLLPICPSKTHLRNPG
jgi:hypothetical protein